MTTISRSIALVRALLADRSGNTALESAALIGMSAAGVVIIAGVAPKIVRAFQTVSLTLGG